jgi:hypothetical protein
MCLLQSRGNKTAIELFLADVAGWEQHVVRLVEAAQGRVLEWFGHDTRLPLIPKRERPLRILGTDHLRAILERIERRTRISEAPVAMPDYWSQRGRAMDE